MMWRMLLIILCFLYCVVVLFELWKGLRISLLCMSFFLFLGNLYSVVIGRKFCGCLSICSDINGVSLMSMFILL